MSRITPDGIVDYTFAHTRPESPLLQKIADETQLSQPMAQMLTGRVEGRFLQLLVRISGARHILEVGLFTGYSALAMAEALPEDGELISCEVDENIARKAQSYLDQSPVGYKVKIRIGEARTTLRQETGPFDMIFLDADKEGYPDYYEMLLSVLRPGGLLIIDNALWSGEVLSPETAEARAIARLNDRICTDERVEQVLLTVRDGIHIVRKKT